MTHQDWITGWVTLVAALAGGVGGGIIVIFTTGWANRAARKIADEDRKAQLLQAAEERNAQAEFAATERRLDAQQQRRLMAKSAAVQILERVAELIHVVPNLVAANGVQGVGSRALEVRNAYRHAVAATLPLVTDAALVTRCKRLDRLLGELTLASTWQPERAERARRDVTAYSRYVRYSIIQFLNDQEMIAETEPPHLQRNEHDGSSWVPSQVPEGWDEM